jgi:FMN phosphatase YigB (HAD superfamily)
MTPLPAVRAMSLDVDGTLYEVTRRRSRLARLLYGDVRRLTSDPRFERSIAAFQRARERARKSVSTGNDRRSFRDHAIAFLMEDLRSNLDAASETYDWMTVAIAIVGTKGLRPYWGVRRAILAAAQRGMKIGIISDYDPRLKLKNLGLDDLPWSAVIACDSVGILKPSPRPFLAFADRLGVEPGMILHVGDREDTDVDGALAAGMRAWRFSPSSESTESRAEHVFSTWGHRTFARLWTS